MQAIGYMRVSAAKQATDGVSLDAQREAIGRWCAGSDDRDVQRRL